jgi:hypothetical protein
MSTTRPWHLLLASRGKSQKRTRSWQTRTNSLIPLVLISAFFRFSFFRFLILFAFPFFCFPFFPSLPHPLAPLVPSSTTIRPCRLVPLLSSGGGGEAARSAPSSHGSVGQGRIREESSGGREHTGERDGPLLARQTLTQAYVNTSVRTHTSAHTPKHS